MKNKSVKILGFNGSPHKDGLCSKLINEALQECEARGADIELIDIVSLNLPFFHGNYEKEFPTGFEWLRKKIVEANGFIFATPVHWFTMSAPMKNFIDWLVTFELDNFSLEGKVAGIITTCEEDGGEKAITDIAAPLMHQGIILPPYSGVFFNKNMYEKSENNWMSQDIKLLAKNVTEMIKHLDSKNINWGY